MHVSVLVFVRCRAVFLVGVTFRAGKRTAAYWFLLPNGRLSWLELLLERIGAR